MNDNDDDDECRAGMQARELFKMECGRLPKTGMICFLRTFFLYHPTPTQEPTAQPTREPTSKPRATIGPAEADRSFLAPSGIRKRTVLRVLLKLRRKVAEVRVARG